MLLTIGVVYFLKEKAADYWSYTFSRKKNAADYVGRVQREYYYLFQNSILS